MPMPCYSPQLFPLMNSVLTERPAHHEVGCPPPPQRPRLALPLGVVRTQRGARPFPVVHDGPPSERERGPTNKRLIGISRQMPDRATGWRRVRPSPGS
jgi:hypothetical protein